ncbi:hypothetical protein HHI36_003466 [Cryptolaemus montrouzieri]|uniref:Proton-coupled folate transporter n=1 Tax=Cryptolaemus montrouzieri TaxID=559131 RepID=A0ABD2PDH3_9CUCU
MSVANLPGAISSEFLASQTDKQKITICEKIKFALTHITVEPISFLFMLASMMNGLASQNLMLEKACRVNLQFNTSICDALTVRNRSGYDFFHENETQQLVSVWTSYRSIVIGSFPVFLMIILGSWSDRSNRRKPVILLPILGEFVGAIGLLLCSFYFLELPIEYAWFFQTVPPSLLGGGGCLALGIYSYVSARTSEEEKTLKIGAVSMCWTVAMSLGMFISGFFLNRVGFKGLFSFSSCILLSGIIYGILVVREEPSEKPKEHKQGILKDLFAFEHVINTFKTCFRKDEGKRRTKIVIIILLGALIFGPLQGEISVVYMYIRLKCGWNEVDFSIYNSFHFCLQLLGTSFALTFFSKHLKLNDAMLGIIAVGSRICSCAIFAIAPSGKYFYLGACIDVFYGTSFISLRAMMAKIVPPHELGQANSVFGICEALMPLIFGFVYTKIYMKTLTFFPGLFYLITVAVYIVAFCLLIYLYKEGKEETRIKLEKTGPTDLEKNLITQKCTLEIKKSREVLRS